LQQFNEKRSSKNSATSTLVGFAGDIDDAILPPADVELRSDKEHLKWSQFTRALASSLPKLRMRPERLSKKLVWLG